MKTDTNATAAQTAETAWQAAGPLLEALPFDCELPGIEAYTTLRGIEAHTALRGGEPQDGDPAKPSPYSAFSLCDHTGDDLTHVERCRQTFCRLTGVDAGRLVMARQEHTTRVAVVDASHLALSAAGSQQSLQGVDALVTTLPDVMVGVNTADCVPVILADPAAGIVAAVHAGWKGTAAGIVSAAVAAMTRLGANAGNIHAAIGASICPDCFEVGEEVVSRFADAGFPMAQVRHTNAVTGRSHIHLQEANAWLLRLSGVPQSHIAVSGACTRCQPLRYFSARRLGIRSGRTFTAVVRRQHPAGT